MKKYLIITTLVLTIVYLQSSAAQEPIMITKSDTMKEVTFDGKWTNSVEWKRSSLNEFRFDTGTIYLRTAHQDNFIFVHINVELDKTIDKGSDRAMVCIDTKNNKSQIPDSDDYCFIVALDRKQGNVIQGGSIIGRTGFFEKLEAPKGFVAAADASDENDRYNKIPHTSYEFKIPTDLVGRSNNYGFYFTIFDASDKRFYSWPNVNPDTPHSVPSPSRWGNIVSPDDSLPEFSLPMLAILLSFVSLIYFTKINRKILC